VNDPRTASANVTAGPADLIGHELVIVTPVVVDGVAVHLPKLLPGLNDYVATAHAEAEAEQLRPRLLEGLDPRGPAAYQPNTEIVFNFLSSAGSVATSAVAGLEAFANHHVARYCAPAAFDDNGDEIEPVPTVEIGGAVYTFSDLTNKPLNERYADILPKLQELLRPTAEDWWPKLRQVQGLAALNRHGITDPVKRKGLEGRKSLVQRLCDREYSGASALMLSVFDYFAPGWIDDDRRELLPPPP
jgi:hypothetical protein